MVAFSPELLKRQGLITPDFPYIINRSAVTEQKYGPWIDRPDEEFTKPAKPEATGRKGSKKNSITKISNFGRTNLTNLVNKVKGGRGARVGCNSDDYKVVKIPLHFFSKLIIFFSLKK